MAIFALMIFYFSGTGNTKWMAEQLADATKENLFFIPEILNGECHFTLGENERIGFCFPVHGWRPPFVVRDFIRKLKLDNASGHYCYAFCTCGDDIGRTMEMLNDDLSIIGLHTDSVFSVIMPESFVGFPFMDVDKPSKRDAKKERAENELKSLSQYIVERKVGIRKVNESHWPRINSNVIGSYFLNKMVTDVPFRVDDSRCVKCGICADVCPVHNIKGGLGFKPEWLHNGLCTTCFNCYHHCPHHAIEYGNKTPNKGQYFFYKK